MKHQTKISINPFSLIYISLGVFSNRGYYLFIYYFIGFIHELFHCLTARILNVKVDEIVFLPFGFIAKINNLLYEKEWKQYLILIMGPLSYFISYYIGKIFLNVGILSMYSYRYYTEANLSILIVNLLPIYPLDGEKIIENIVSHFINEFKLRIFRIGLSFITLFISIYIMFSLGNLVSFAFLTIILVQCVINLRKEYIYFLLNRGKMHLKKVKVITKIEVYRFYTNYLISNSMLLNEDEIIRKILLLEKNDEKYANYRNI